VTGVIETASSGRAKCRACGRMIGKGELRFGEKGPNPFGEGEATYWFHLRCAACKRPEPALAALQAAPDVIDERDELLSVAQRGVEHPKLSRIAGVQRSPSGRARCRHCRDTIDKDRFRIALDWWEDGRFGGAGYVHATCAPGYFGATEDLALRLRFTVPDLGEADLAAVLADAGVAAP
jgi:hypothetical protein